MFMSGRHRLCGACQGDIIVKHRPDLNFDGLRPAPDRVLGSAQLIP